MTPPRVTPGLRRTVAELIEQRLGRRVRKLVHQSEGHASAVFVARLDVGAVVIRLNTNPAEFLGTKRTLSAACFPQRFPRVMNCAFWLFKSISA